MNDTPALRAEGLTKHYGDLKALVDVSLEVAAGEIFGFLGPNGAGKTTMIRTLMDEIRATAGRAWILGLDCHEQSVEIRRHIGYLPSDLALYPNLTGQDTLTYFANLREGVDWDNVAELARRLEAQLDKKVGDLSSGNRQKIGVIQAFMSRPKLLIMDEPSSGLDPLVQRELQSIMREVVADGAAIFLSSHTLSEVQRVADRVGIIRHGHLIAQESVVSLRSKGLRSIEFDLATPADAARFEAIPGVRDVLVENGRVQLGFEGQMDALLNMVTQEYEVLDIRSQEADLEEIFLTYYHDEA